MKQKFGICEWSLPVSGAAAMVIASDIGYEGIQIGEAGGRSMGYPLCNRRVAEIYIATAEKTGIKLHSLNLGALLAEGTLNYDTNTARGAAARESLEKGIQACELMSIDTVVITADPQTQQAEENVISHLEYALNLAENSGIQIALESACPLEEILRIEERVSGRLKICMDILNPLRFGTGDPVDQIEVFGTERISHFHMKDSIKKLFSPGQRGCVLLGTGDGEYKESVKKIKEIGYEGWLISENYYYLPPMSCSGKDSVSLAAADLDTLHRSFGQV